MTRAMELSMNWTDLWLPLTTHWLGSPVLDGVHVNGSTARLGLGLKPLLPS